MTPTRHKRATTSDLFDDDEETAAFAAVYLPYLLAAYKQGVRLGLAQGNGTLTIENVFTDAVKAAIRQKSYEHASDAIGTTRDQLAKLVEEAATQGQGTAELAKNIRDAFDFNSKVRSLRIARTEMTDTINDGTTTTLRKEGYRQKTWSTVIDGRERETHAEADGQTVGIDEPFRVGGESAFYPGDSNLSPENRINCRCATIAGGTPEDRIKPLGNMFLRAHGSLEHQFMVALRKAFLAQRDRLLSRL